MKVELWGIGKTKLRYLQEAEQDYEKRLKHYLSFSWKIFPPVKGNLQKEELMKKEAELYLQQLKSEDFVVLLDENGASLHSEGFAEWLQQGMNRGIKKIVFITGGAWGFDSSMKERAQFTLSLSKMTFTHQMVRTIFVEQLYRAMTIIKNEPYHNT